MYGILGRRRWHYLSFKLVYLVPYDCGCFKIKDAQSHVHGFISGERNKKVPEKKQNYEVRERVNQRYDLGKNL